MIFVRIFTVRQDGTEIKGTDKVFACESEESLERAKALHKVEVVTKFGKRELEALSREWFLERCADSNNSTAVPIFWD